MRGLSFLLVGVLASLVIFSFQISESVLWDLLINVTLENDPLQTYEKPTVKGAVVDHAGKPVSNALVEIRLEKESSTTLTNMDGKFTLEFDYVTVPGYYVVDVKASTDDSRMGLARTYFQVKGPVLASTQSSYDLDLINSMYKEKISAEQVQNDPIGLTLYNYYQELQTKLLEEEQKQKEIEKYQEFLEEQRSIAFELEQKIIEEENPGAGTYSGFKYDQFVDNLDLSVREIIVNQLNYTINAFNEAQFAMEEVLENGGTISEARQAYYEKAAVPRDLMESLSSLNEIEELSDESEEFADTPTMNLQMELNTNLEDVSSESEPQISENSQIIPISENTTTLYLNINGTIVELFVNGTDIIQAE